MEEQVFKIQIENHVRKKERQMIQIRAFKEKEKK